MSLAMPAVGARRGVPESIPRTPESEGWVALSLAGDVEARERLADWAGRSAYSFALRLLRNRDDAQDVAQDAVIRLFGSLGSLDESRPVKPWLYRIVRNLVVDRSRRARFRRGSSLDSLLETNPALEPVASEVDAQRELERHDLRRRLWEALGRLQRAHAEILVLRDYEDLSYREIAEILGIPLGTVMSRLHAARKALRAQLLDECYVFGGLTE